MIAAYTNLHDFIGICLIVLSVIFLTIGSVGFLKARKKPELKKTIFVVFGGLGIVTLVMGFLFVFGVIEIWIPS